MKPKKRTIEQDDLLRPRLIDIIDMRHELVRLAEQLATLQGRFILSINDVPEIRTIFAAFQIDAVTTTYSIANCGAGSNDRAELLISRL